jgi:hypothetical protein
MLLQLSPQERNQSELDPATEVAVQKTLHVQATFQDMSRSATAGHRPRSVLELRRAETTTSASQLEAHLQTALVGKKQSHNTPMEA